MGILEVSAFQGKSKDNLSTKNTKSTKIFNSQHVLRCYLVDDMHVFKVNLSLFLKTPLSR